MVCCAVLCVHSVKSNMYTECVCAFVAQTKLMAEKGKIDNRPPTQIYVHKIYSKFRMGSESRRAWISATAAIYSLGKWCICPRIVLMLLPLLLLLLLLLFAFARFILCKTITAMLMLTKLDQKCLNMLCFIFRLVTFAGFAKWEFLSFLCWLLGNCGNFFFGSLSFCFKRPNDDDVVVVFSFRI